MIKGLLSILNAIEGEEKPVLLILAYGFFMGVFLAAYKIVATSLFLSHLSEHIDKAFLVSGIVGVISTYAYANLQNRVHYSRLIIFNLVSIFLFVAATRILFFYSDADWLIFALFVMLGPITSLMVLGFWGIFGRMFDLRQSKRIIGGIDSGQLTAIIITTFSIPFLIPYITEITNLLVIGEIGLAVALIIFIVIKTNFKLSSFHQKHKELRKETQFRNMIRNKYVVYLALFLSLSMAAFVFVDFSFMNVAEQQYPKEKQLASFLGVFEGSIMILSLIIQTFANERILTMYGMRTSLLILPLILVIFTAASIFAGHVFGFDVTDASFIWFFLFIALSKLFVTTLREATENPVFKLFFMPLDSRIRFDIQTKIEGTINELSRALSGGLIMLLGLIPFFKLIHFSWILLLIIGGWTYMIFKIYHLYRESIKSKLKLQKSETDSNVEKGKQMVIRRLSESMETKVPGIMLFALRTLSRIAPENLNEKIEQLKKDDSSEVNKIVLKTLEEENLYIDPVKLLEIEAKKSAKITSSSSRSSRNLDAEIAALSKSQDVEDRVLAAELVVVVDTEECRHLLPDLLNDSEKSVVNAAIKSVAELKVEALLPQIVDYLHKDKHKDTALEGLVSYGQDAFPFLESIFINSEQEVDIKIDIIHVLGRVGGEKAWELLWDKIDYPDKLIVAEVFMALSHSGFEANEEQKSRVKQAIEEDVANIVWFLKATEQFMSSEDQSYLDIGYALREVTEHNYQHIYRLLSMIYDRKSIQLVKENIETKTHEGTTYAVELLDVFLSEDLKHKIIPILDDTSDLDKVRRLSIYYPSVHISNDELIRSILNRDFNQTNRWTKACILKYIGDNKIADKYEMELISNLFNPDHLLQEVSAWSLNEISEALFQKNLNRLPDADRDHLRNLKLGQEFGYASELRPHMRYEIIQFLKAKSALSELPFHILANIVDFFEDMYIEEKTVLEAMEWDNESFYIVYHGNLEVKNERGELIDQYDSGDFLGEQIHAELIEKDIRIYFEEDALLLKIDKNRFMELITDEYLVTLKILESFTVESENT